MLRKIFLPAIFLILAYGFWISTHFQVIAAGVAIFLFGMISMEEGFKAFTGGILERILRKSTSNLWKSMSFGLVTTTLMQSSSLVSVITISFLSAGLIGLFGGIGIIFGANLGTTTGAWLVAGFGLKVKLSAYAMPMLAFGVTLLFQSSKALKGFGYILAGLGFLFLGIDYMKEGFETFSQSISLADYAVGGYRGLFLFVLLGIMATVVMQSSHATLVLIITALAAHQISYENALALAIGANVGTTVTAILGALSANTEGKRLAWAHFVFNVVTGVLAIVLISQLVWLVHTLSEAMGIPENDDTLKLALFHTLFNLMGVIVLSPFIRHLVSVLERLVKTPEDGLEKPIYLNDAALSIPETALECARKEAIHLYENAFDLIANSLSLSSKLIESEADLKTAVGKMPRMVRLDIDVEYERKIKTLFSSIIEFISKAHEHIPVEWTDKLYKVRQASQDIVEAVKDVKHLRKNLVRYMVSDNANIRREYNNLRLRLATVLREIAALRSTPPNTVTILSLDSAKLQLEDDNRRIGRTLDLLIRQSAISPQMATSLMNDASYTYDIGRNLIEMAQTLFEVDDLDVQAANESVILSDEELKNVLETTN